MLYLLNAPILTSYGYFLFEKITVEEAKEIIRNEREDIVSAVGHEATAKIMSSLLDYPVIANRVAIIMEKGDKAIVFRLLERLPEGKVLSEEELTQLPYELGLLWKFKPYFL